VSALLEPHLDRVSLALGKSIFEANEPIELVYFPEGGVCSIVSVQDSGEMVEVGLFGFEGMSGSHAFRDLQQMSAMGRNQTFAGTCA
jgi:predicted alpha/beta-fold hydrolase